MKNFNMLTMGVIACININVLLFSCELLAEICQGCPTIDLIQTGHDSIGFVGQMLNNLGIGGQPGGKSVEQEISEKQSQRDQIWSAYNGGIDSQNFYLQYLVTHQYILNKLTESYNEFLSSCQNLSNLNVNLDVNIDNCYSNAKKHLFVITSSIRAIKDWISEVKYRKLPSNANEDLFHKIEELLSHLEKRKESNERSLLKYREFYVKDKVAQEYKLQSQKLVTLDRNLSCDLKKDKLGTILSGIVINLVYSRYKGDYYPIEKYKAVANSMKSFLPYLQKKCGSLDEMIISNHDKLQNQLIEFSNIPIEDWIVRGCKKLNLTANDALFVPCQKKITSKAMIYSLHERIKQERNNPSIPKVGDLK